MRLRGGQRTWWSSVNVRWSADINFPKHFNANINAFKGTWLSKYIHHNKPYCLINVRVRGRFTLSMLLYSLSTFILRTGSEVAMYLKCHVPTCPVSRVTCPRVTTCHGPARTAAKGGCCTVDIFTSTPITTLEPVHCISSRWVQRLKCNYSHPAACGWVQGAARADIQHISDTIITCKQL